MRRAARRALAVAVAVLAGAWCACSAAQPAGAPIPDPAPEPSSAPVRPLTGAQLLAQLSAGGLVVYFRHTATDFSRDDKAMRDYDDCANQRLLTPRGRADARAIGEHWKRLGIPVGAVLASPYCRTRDVAQQMFGRHERMDDVRGGPIEAGGDRYAGLRRLMSTPPPGRANLVISSHGNPFRAIAGPPYLGEGEAAVVRPLGGGRFEVIARVPVDGWKDLPGNP
jgi:hypothetical protein